MGRPSKLTPAIHDALVASLTGGNYRDTAAKTVGIHVATLYRWIERGEADIEHDKATPYRDLCEALTRAEAEAEQFAVTCLRDAMSEDWRAAQAFLERKHFERWGKREAVDVKHSGSLDLGAKTEAELIEMAALLDERADAR